MNLDILKQKRAEGQALAASRGTNRLLWKPEEGDQTIRIVPYIHNTEWVFTEMWVHYNICKTPLVSPLSYGHPDPIKEYGDYIREHAGKDKNMYALARMCEPKLTFYVPILVRGKENEGVKFWGLGITNYNKLLDFFNEPAYGDLSDPINGMDIKISYKKAGPGPKDYAATSIMPLPMRVPATTDPAIGALIQQTPTVQSLFTEPSFDECQLIIKKFTENGGKVVDLSAAPTPAPGTANIPVPTAAPASNVFPQQQNGVPIMPGFGAQTPPMNNPLTAINPLANTAQNTAAYNPTGVPTPQTSEALKNTFAQYFKPPQA